MSEIRTIRYRICPIHCAANIRIPRPHQPAIVIQHHVLVRIKNREPAIAVICVGRRYCLRRHPPDTPRASSQHGPRTRAFDDHALGVERGAGQGEYDGKISNHSYGPTQ